MPGLDGTLETQLKGVQQLQGVVRCREGNYDFLVRVEAPGFEVVDDILRTYVQRLPGVKGIEPITDWTHYSDAVAQARAQLG